MSPLLTTCHETGRVRGEVCTLVAKSTGVEVFVTIYVWCKHACKYMYECMTVCACVCAYVRVYVRACIYACMFVCMHIWVYVRVYVTHACYIHWYKYTLCTLICMRYFLIRLRIYQVIAYVFIKRGGYDIEWRSSHNSYLVVQFNAQINKHVWRPSG